VPTWGFLKPPGADVLGDERGDRGVFAQHLVLPAVLLVDPQRRDAVDDLRLARGPHVDPPHAAGDHGAPGRKEHETRDGDQVEHVQRVRLEVEDPVEADQALRMPERGGVDAETRDQTADEAEGDRQRRGREEESHAVSRDAFAPGRLHGFHDPLFLRLRSGGLCRRLRLLDGLHVMGLGCRTVGLLLVRQGLEVQALGPVVEIVAAHSRFLSPVSKPVGRVPFPLAFPTHGRKTPARARC
jgi:hypothetical protein